jgi:hypothetical protein
MSSRNLSAPFVPVAFFLAIGLFAIARAAHAAPASPSLLKSGESAGKDNVIEIKYRRRGPRLYLPIVPYIAYDYPYYYYRGHYPTHIGPGYIYYGYPYFYRRYYSRFGGRCAGRKCVAGWRYVRDPASPHRQKARKD